MSIATGYGHDQDARHDVGGVGTPAAMAAIEPGAELAAEDVDE
jgi:hypothetical protein